MESRKAMLENLLASPYLSRFIAGARRDALARHPSRPIVAAAVGALALGLESALRPAACRSGPAGETYLSLGYSGTGADLLAVTSRRQLVQWTWIPQRAMQSSPPWLQQDFRSRGRSYGDRPSAPTPAGMVAGRPIGRRYLPNTNKRKRKWMSYRRVLGETSLPVGHGKWHPLWDVAAAAYRPTPFVGHCRPDQTRVAFSADGRKLASGSMDERRDLWDVRRIGVGQMAKQDPGCHRRP